MRSVVKGLKDPQFRGLLISVILLLLAGMLFYHQIEEWSWLDALYFSLITLTTVGYGDFSPQTSAGKIFTMFYIVLGLGVLSSFLLMVAERQLDDRISLWPRREKSTQTEEEEGEVGT
ncbi:MAG: two pore domain potassium channel family protein [Ardenticatenaceae bacterium]|nr:two pore domain potassium channel family protein [Ardenticatenaceae bacterium]MCB8992181.1 two pore domain potassium channel family protein [Ardenticatenaceae bacterium]MCB9004289.1 two pore domain potassium channel family protein [Ardenticatenaceae bacterium]